MKSNLANDPALTAFSRMKRGNGVVGSDPQLASQPTMSRLLSILSTLKNRARLVHF